jgi:hypothetical protein
MRNTPLQFFPAGKVISVIADNQLPVARVVELIDLCHAAGAKVLLVTSGT